jgi:hypothetical protein
VISTAAPRLFTLTDVSACPRCGQENSHDFRFGGLCGCELAVANPPSRHTLDVLARHARHAMIVAAGLLVLSAASWADAPSGGILRGLSSSTCDLRWTQDGSFPGRVQDVRVLRNGEGWAAGWAGRTVPLAFVAHRKDGRWAEQREGGGKIWSLSAGSPTDVWAVGNKLHGPAWLLRYSGRRWRWLPPPRDRFEVGSAARSSPVFAFARHDRFSFFASDGKRLRTIPRASVTKPGFGDFTASGPRHFWLMGDFSIDVWNGSSWRTDLHQVHVWIVVDAASLTNAWALDGDGGSAQWDGRRWRRYPYVGTPPRFDALPIGVVAVSRNEAWALLQHVASDKSKSDVLRWDGNAWRRLRPPAPIFNFRFTSIDVSASNSVWLAGYVRSERHATSTIFHGTCA